MHPFAKIVLAKSEAERDAARTELHKANATRPTDREPVAAFLKDCTAMDTGAPLTLDDSGAVVTLQQIEEKPLARTLLSRALVLYRMPDDTVADQAALEEALTTFRGVGYTACVVRSFVPDTVYAHEVDVQLMAWPLDVPAGNGFEGIRYDMPVLHETKRFVALRDGEAEARMELIPGYMLALLGNSDTEKSTKHKFARGVVKGLSDGQKAMYGAQGYGPGISLCALASDGNVSGLTRLAVRTDGPQYPNLMSIPTPHFLEADKVKYFEKSAESESAD